MAEFRAIPAFKRVIASFIADFGVALHISWPWFALVAGIATIVFTLYPEVAVIFLRPWTLTNEQALSASSTIFVSYLLFSIVYCSIAVNWHRYLLLSEIPEGLQRLRLDWPVLRYFGNLLLLFVILLVPVLVVSVMLAIPLGLFDVATGGRAGAALGGILGAVLMAVFAASTYRLSIKLPAIALDEEYGFRDGWRDSRGTTFRLFGYFLLLLLAGLPFGLLGLGPQLLKFITGEPSHVVQISAWLITQLATWANIMLSLTAITLLYAIFAEGAEV